MSLLVIPIQLLLLLTEREEDVLQLAQHHRPVLHLVVQLQTLNEVLERAGILGVLHLLVDGVELEIRFNKRTKTRNY